MGKKEERRIPAREQAIGLVKDFTNKTNFKQTKKSYSGKPKKSFKNFETSKSQGKHSVVIEKTSNKIVKKGSSFRPNKTRFSSKIQINPNDFEKRKLAEQRATKRLKDEGSIKDKKIKLGTKKRETKLTVSRALSDEIEARERSLASVKRAREKEQKNLNKEESKENLKPIKRDVKIPEVITIRELANRMAEQSSNIIKHLLGMGAVSYTHLTLPTNREV